ncbi:MAG: hypothetical protein J6Z12_00150, partial [Paludibacteraceae bacterium]|nr:hypothetical protein [Paludibacteraceae bacterium]
MKRLILSWSLALLCAVTMDAASIRQVGGGLRLTFENPGGAVSIQRSTGRFSPFTEIGTTNGTTYTDNTIGNDPYSYYYHVVR